MTIDDSFTVQAPAQRVWDLLKDVPRVAGCIPGAAITETIDAHTYRGTVSVKAGPVSVSYNATISIAQLDDAGLRATLDVRGDDIKGRGGVRATVTSQAVAEGPATRVNLHADAHISGIIASVGGRLIESVAKKTIVQFATNLSALLA